MDQPEQQPFFLDVPQLIERSSPQGRHSWFWYAGGLFLLIVMISTYVGIDHPGVVQAASLLGMMILIGVMSAATFFMVRNQRAQQEQIQAASELIQLRRWPEAAVVVRNLLSRPTHSAGVRAQAMINLASILARYHRFDDAIMVEEHLLEHLRMDPGTEYGLRLGRAMAMLREDRLVDADRAINELWRVGGEESGGLALVEIYRDVKTGHPAEAVEIFNQRSARLREQLGHRAGDAYALIAKAYDLMGKEAEARAAWEKATLLTPMVELTRRYPETSSVAERFGVTPMPAEVTA